MIKARCTGVKRCSSSSGIVSKSVTGCRVCVENVLLKEQNGAIVSPIECILSGIREKKKLNILDVDTICQNLLSPQAVRHVVIRIDKKDTPRIASIVVVWRSEGTSRFRHDSVRERIVEE